MSMFYRHRGRIPSLRQVTGSPLESPVDGFLPAKLFF